MNLDAVDEVCSDEIAQQANIGPVLNAAAAVEPQYVVHQPPRLQLGNAPLVGTPAYDGLDQIEILWQTLPAGTGNEDAFVVQCLVLPPTQTAPVRLQKWVVLGE